jgi:predicted GIY-YIG superfamily endonuclease
MQLQLLSQVLLTLALLIDLCIGVPVKERASSSRPTPASTSNAASKTKVRTRNAKIDLSTQIDVERKLNEAGVHSLMNARQLHKLIEPIIPIRRTSRVQTDYAIQHLHKIGVDPQVIRRFKKHRKSASGKGEYASKPKETIVVTKPKSSKLRPDIRGRRKFEKHIGRIDFNAEPQEAARQWWRLGAKGRTTNFSHHLDTLLSKNVVSGTHSHVWKDEFKKSQEAMISEFRQKKVDPKEKNEYGPAQGQVDKELLNNVASTSKTLPVEAHPTSPTSSSSAGEQIQLFGVRMRVGRKGKGKASTSIQSPIAPA